MKRLLALVLMASALLAAERPAGSTFDGWVEDFSAQWTRNSAELFRAKRLVVDTGLHTKGWTRQQAIDYGIPVSEVERYVVNPGQACTYMIGMLRILELRERAKTALGPAFLLPALHDVILCTGTVPLELLGEVVDGWIAAQRREKSGAR